MKNYAISSVCVHYVLRARQEFVFTGSKLLSHPCCVHPLCVVFEVNTLRCVCLCHVIYACGWDMFTLGVAQQATVVFFGKLYIYHLTSLCLTFHYDNILWPVLKWPTVLLLIVSCTSTSVKLSYYSCATVSISEFSIWVGKSKWVMILYDV